MRKQTVLVTGASSGFGKLVALNFARKGYHVFATATRLDSERVNEITALIQAEQLSWDWLKLDVTNLDDIAAAVKQITPRGLDLLVNNAGIGMLGPVETFSAEAVKQQLDINFLGAVRMTYAFLPLLRNSPRARILNMSSIAGVLVAPAYALYAASKHALEAFTEALYYELYDSNIAVALVEPSGFDTNFSAHSTDLRKDATTAPQWFVRAQSLRNKQVGIENNIVKKSRDPQIVADALVRIAEAKRPKLRNFVGKGAYLAYLVRRFLPASLWQWVMVTAIRYFSK